MKIECTLQRKGGTEVIFDAASAKALGVNLGRYHFKPIDPDKPDSPHVADVDDSGHIKRFLSIDGFLPFDPVTTVAAPALKTQDTTPESQPTQPADEFDASAVQKQSVRALREQLQALDAEQVRAVLDIEQGDDEPRQSVIDACMARIRALEA